MIDLAVGSKRVKQLAELGLALLTFQTDGTTLLEYAARAGSPMDILLMILRVYRAEDINRCNSYRLSFFHLLVLNYSLAEVKLVLESSCSKFRFSNPVYNGLVTFIKNAEAENTVRRRMGIIPLVRSYGYIVDSEEIRLLTETSPCIALEVVIDDGLPADKSLSASILLSCLCRDQGTTRSLAVCYIQSNQVKLADYFEQGEPVAKYLQTQHRNSVQMKAFLITLNQCGWTFSIEDAMVLVSKNHIPALLGISELADVVAENSVKLILVYILKRLTDAESRPEITQLKQTISKIASRSRTSVWRQSVAPSELGDLPPAHCLEDLPTMTIMTSFLACIELARFNEDWISDTEVEDLMCWFYVQGYVTVEADVKMALRIRHCPGIISFLLIKPTDPNLKIEANVLRELRFIDNNSATIRALTPFLVFEDDLDYNAASVALSWMGRDLNRYEGVMTYFIAKSTCNTEKLIEVSVNFMLAIAMYEPTLILLAESRAPSSLQLIMPSVYNDATAKLLLFYYVNCISYGKWRGAPPPLSLLAASRMRVNAQRDIFFEDCNLPTLVRCGLSSKSMRILQVENDIEALLQDMID
ncbi:hypothetical protein HDE_04243 [Halotydeus destructor]|nr:hypothetical protein HDE_04243 [Halotydeus destructor]